MAQFFFFRLILVHLLLFYTECTRSVHVALYATEDTFPKLTNDVALGSWKAKIFYRADLMTSGWDYLEVQAGSNISDTEKAYASGYVEGNVTKLKISQHIHNSLGNYCKEVTPFCKRLQNYMAINFAWISQQIARNPQDPYWYQLSLILAQLNGLFDGYLGRKYIPRTKIDTTVDFRFLIFQFQTDIAVLEQALHKKGKLMHMHGAGSCSALIKLLPHASDLLSSHVTWNHYESMLRIQKKYDINLALLPGSNVTIAGHSIAFSSYPGLIYSVDDFYVTSSKLVTIETTNGNENKNLLKYITPKGTVLEGLRTILANRLAITGQSWAYWFSLYNSGTYNNQWMIVDYKLFQKHKPLQRGTLTILEQIPSLIISKDQTKHLEKEGYWGSYNIPFYKDIYHKSGMDEMARKYGDFFTHERSPRGLIFKRDQVGVRDVPTMLRLMRYNNFKHDPLARCNCTPPYSGENGISARSDLNPADGKYPFPALGRRLHGGTDAKVISSNMVPTCQFLAINGPTFDQQPPFRWSSSGFNSTSHLGLPDLMKFSQTFHTWQNPCSN